MSRRKKIHGHRRRRSPIRQESIWGSKATTSIAPKQADTSAFAPKPGSFAAGVVDAVVPKSAFEALTMIGGAGVVHKSKKVLKVGKSILSNFSGK